MKKNPFKILWMITGFICLCLGTIGVILPILPTVPFYMATAFCFAKSSERLHGWFVSTGMYQKHLASFVERKAMTMKTKMHDSYHSDDHYGVCICHDEKCSDRKNLSGSCMDFSYFIFFPSCRNDQRE